MNDLTPIRHSEFDIGHSAFPSSLTAETQRRRVRVKLLRAGLDS
jgi:hypothetical protein